MAPDPDLYMRCELDEIILGGANIDTLAGRLGVREGKYLGSHEASPLRSAML